VTTKNRLFEIAELLKSIAVQRAILRRDIGAFDDKITFIKRDLIPEGGWPGKNADERKAAEISAYHNSTYLNYWEGEKKESEEFISQLDTYRMALLEERSAYEWTIRDNEVVARGGASVFQDDHDESKED